MRQDDDIHAAARALAEIERCSMGQALSRLARRGLAPRPAPLGRTRGFPVVNLPPGSPVVTPEMVRRAIEDD